MNEIQTLGNIKDSMQFLFFHFENLMAMHISNLVRLIYLFYGISNKTEFYEQYRYLQEG